MRYAPISDSRWIEVEPLTATEIAAPTADDDGLDLSQLSAAPGRPVAVALRLRTNDAVTDLVAILHTYGAGSWHRSVALGAGTTLFSGQSLDAGDGLVFAIERPVMERLALQLSWSGAGQVGYEAAGLFEI